MKVSRAGLEPSQAIAILPPGKQAWASRQAVPSSTLSSLRYIPPQYIRRGETGSAEKKDPACRRVGSHATCQDDLRQRTIDRAVRFPDPWSHHPYYGNNKNCDERENDGVLDQALTFLFWCEEHNNKSFLK